MEKDIKIFGDIYLDTDTDPKVNKGSDYILNSIIQSDGRFKLLVNVKGNEVFTDHSLLNGYFGGGTPYPKAVGSCKDFPRNRIIYFVTKYITPNYYSVIFYLDINTGENKAIYGGWDLNLTYTAVVQANVIGDLLYFTDGVNPPRKINYIKAYNYTNSISTTYIYQALDSQSMEAYKKPPSAQITYLAATSLAVTKVIPAKIYQFAYRYVYSDYEKSVLSPFSDVIFSDVQQFPDGTGNLTTSVYAIYLYFKIFEYVGGLFNDVDSVELFVRNSDSGNWYLYDKINSPKLTSFSLSYYSHGSFDDSSGYTSTIDIGYVTQDVYNSLSVGQHITYSSVDYYIVNKTIVGTQFLIYLDTTVGGTLWTYTFTVIDSFTYTFKDDKIKQEVDQVDLARPYDFLPKLAVTQELIEKDKLIYGDITEGFDNFPINISTSVISSLTDIQQEAVVSNASYTLSSSIVKVYWNAYNSNILYAIFLFNYNLTINVVVSYISKDGDTETTILNVLANFLIANGIPNVSVATNISPSYKYIKVIADGGIFVGSGGVGVTASSYAPKHAYKTLRRGDSYLIGIQYYDSNLRYSAIQKSDIAIDIPDYPYGLIPSNELSKVYSIDCSIKNKPPISAFYYSISFTKRIKSKYQLQLLCNGFLAYFDVKDGWLRIPVNKIINNYIDKNKNLKINTYSYSSGDKIKILGIGGPSFAGFPLNVDVEIKGVEWPKTDSRYQKDYATSPSYIVDSSGNKTDSLTSQVIIVPITMKGLESISIMIGVSGPYFISYDMLFEIYTPSKESSNPYYFPNYFGKIGNPGTSNNYHIGTSQNQNPISPLATPAIVNCNPGDCYLRLRMAEVFFPAIDDNYSDYYESNSYGLGMPNIFDPDAKQEHLISGMRNSGSLLENSKVNKLNQFKSEDLEILKSKFGSINSLKEVGNVLKVLQDKKETSIYISRTEMQNADNTSNVVKSTALLGTANSSEEDRGTLFSRSVKVHNRNMYYFDLYRGEVIRSSPNGQFPISEYGMRTYFKSKSKSIQAVGLSNVDIISAFDEENKMYLLTFIMAGNSETIGFYDPEIESEKPRWISFFSFIPEHYESFESTLISFANGHGYRHNANSVNRGTFYGVKYKQQVNWYSNANPIIKKVFKVLGIKSNKKWDVPMLIIEADSTYIRGMQSLLKTNHFELKEGEFSSAYLNNMKTTSNTPSTLDLFNGDSLRGYALKHQIENLENGEIWLLESSVSYDASNQY